MALERGDSIYLSVINGKLAKKVNTKTPTSVERTNKNNKVVNEELYKSLSGSLVKLEERNHAEYGDSMRIFIKDDVMYCIELPFDSQYATAFLKTLPSVDLSKPIVFAPGEKKENEKVNQSIFLKQNGEWLKRYYSKDSAHRLPEPKMKKVRGKEEWDYTEVNDFLYKEVFLVVKGKLEAIAAGDDLPF